MTLMWCVVEIATGRVEEIGRDGEVDPWDYRIERIETGLVDASGDPILRDEITRPMPPAFELRQVEIVTGWDGGLYAADDLRRLSPTGIEEE